MAEEFALTKKYRPKKLADVIGQPVVVTAFSNALKYKTLKNAYILGGKFGTGKTTIARIIAASENCEKGSTLEPCGVCDNCKAIFSGKSFDVIEMDAASNRGIDDIRAIHKSLYTSPIQCRTKYVIIDEAHSLTGQGAEAALKMIEEPPAYVRFILCTTDTQSIKETISSRCILWKFNSVSWTDLFNHLKNISSLENLNIDDDALRIAAKSSKGSVRNSLQNLQTLIDFVGPNKITADLAKQALGAIDDKVYFDLFDAIFAENRAACLKTIQTIFIDGKDAGSVAKDIYNHLDRLMTARICPNDLTSFAFSEDEIKRFSHQSESIKGDVIISIMNLMSRAVFDINYSLDPVAVMNKFAASSCSIINGFKKKAVK